MTTKTFDVEGMMCTHCAAHVKEALEEVEGVKSAAVSLENKQAAVTYDEATVTPTQLAAAVKEAGYDFKA